MPEALRHRPAGDVSLGPPPALGADAGLSAEGTAAGSALGPRELLPGRRARGAMLRLRHLSGAWAAAAAAGAAAGGEETD